MAGDEELAARFIALIDPLRYPQDGLGEEAVREIRRLKARMESERLPRGADPTTHTKLGRGGLSDVEWTVQLLQLQHGARQPGAADHPDPARAGGGPRTPGWWTRRTPRCWTTPGCWPPGCATR